MLAPPSQLELLSSASVPALLAPDLRARARTLEFFTAHIRNANTRKAYARAGQHFADWCVRLGIGDIRQVQPVHVALYVEQLDLAAPSVKQRLAALRALFDWLVVGQVMPTNPASAVRGPRHSVKTGKTPVLSAREVRELVESIDAASLVGMRDRALIGTMVYTCARVGAVTRLRVEDVYTQRRRLWVRLDEKGGKRREMPCHHRLEEWLYDYLEAAGIADDPRGPLFRSARASTGTLSQRPMSQADVYRMVRRRADAAGIATAIGCHSFRATGITEYLLNGGKLEIAQQMANHESSRTTGLYDRRGDQIKLEEVERIGI